MSASAQIISPEGFSRTQYPGSFDSAILYSGVLLLLNMAAAAEAETGKMIT